MRHSKRVGEWFPKADIGTRVKRQIVLDLHIVIKAMTFGAVENLTDKLLANRKITHPVISSVAKAICDNRKHLGFMIIYE